MPLSVGFEVGIALASTNHHRQRLKKAASRPTSTSCQFFPQENSSALRKSLDTENGILTREQHRMARPKMRLKGHAEQEQATRLHVIMFFYNEGSADMSPM